jgi:hypothetical protein
MRSLVGACCGPRTLSFRRTEFGSASRAGRNAFKSTEEISRTSPLESVGDLRLGIPFDLASIGTTKTDDTNAIFGLDKAQDIWSLAQHPWGDIARFTVTFSIIEAYMAASK